MPYTADQLELLAHLEAERDRVKAWVAEAPGRFATYSPVDLEFHAENGVFSLADLERQDLINGCSEAYKDAYGSRPRWNFSEMSIEELREEYARLADAASEACKAAREEQDAAVVAFKAEVAQNLMLGADSVVTAVEWIRDAYQDEFDRMYGDENLEYRLNVPYGFVKQYLAGEA